MIGEPVRLRVINRSAEAPPPEVALWQVNDAPASTSVPVVWKVIRRCWRDWTHPFDLPAECWVRLRPTDGADLDRAEPRVPVRAGTRLGVSLGKTGGARLERARAGDPSTFELCHLGGRGVLSAEIWRGDRLLALQPRMVPGQIARFRFRPSIWLSATSRVQEGAPLDGGTWPGRPVSLDLFGLVSADIVMTGGGPGSRSTPLTFHLVDGRSWPV